MRRVFFALFATLTFGSVQASLAADMPLKAPPPPAPVSSWTGFYGGINGGYSVGRDPFNQTLSDAGVSASSSIDSRVSPLGGLFGGQFGYNFQSGHIVWGLEGDIQWANQNDTSGCGLECINEPGVTVATLGSVEQEVKWFGTARGRLGYANDSWLLYVTGGAAWGGIDATTAFSVATGGPTTAASQTTSFTKGGWVFGGGTEVRLMGPWTAKFEYLYMDLGSISDTLAITALGGANLTTNSSIRDNIVRAGLNYRFDWTGTR
jgi:outer membrane immunogenic protein